MKKYGFLAGTVFFLSLALSAVYGHQKDSSTNPAAQGVAKEFKEVAQTTKATVKEDYEKYRKKAQGELDEYKKKMKELGAKAKNLKDKAKEEAKEGMDDLQGKMNVAEQKLKSMKSATGEAWEKVKAEVDSAMESVKVSYEKIASRFK